jgi:hypothetical protein
MKKLQTADKKSAKPISKAAQALNDALSGVDEKE